MLKASWNSGVGMYAIRSHHALALLASVALASCSKTEDPLNGAWQVRTGLMGQNPSKAPRYMDGTLLISDGPNGGKQCSLALTQHSYSPWNGFKIGEYETSSGQETCQIVRSGDIISIQSNVTSGANWTPDNFELSLAGNTMTGKLTSGDGTEVTMYRKGSSYTLPDSPAGFTGRATFSTQKEGWFKVADTSGGCRIDFKSPLKPLNDPVSIRLWIRDSCGGTTKDGIEYDRMEQLAWYVCEDNKLYSEAEIYFKNGERVSSWSPTLYGINVDGPEIRKQGIGGTTLQANAAYRVLFDKVCA